MARKVINTTHSADRYDILSQTPKNYSSSNYFLKELQDKVNADWAYRPNRVDIEYEDDWGQQTYSPIEVVIQSVKSEKGTSISDDCKAIVFKNIFEDRFTIGNRFRFASRFGDDTVQTEQMDPDHSNCGKVVRPKQLKNVWLVTNYNSVNMTSSVVIERCNGTLGSLYTDAQGVSHRHYEPVIQGRDLTSVSFSYNETAVSPQSQLLIIAQHNDYTRDYFINQRFIVGYDKVYRIKAINKFYSNSTDNPEDVGLMRIYLELTESSPYDDFENRIAYQSTGKIIIDNKDSEQSENYTIGFTSPEIIPIYLDSAGVTFTPEVRNGDVVVDNTTITLECELANLPATVDINNYISIEMENGSYTIKRKRVYLRGNLTLIWTGIDDGTGEKLVTTSFELNLSQTE